MKKLVYSLAVLFAVSLVSCGGAKEAANDTDSPVADSPVVESAPADSQVADSQVADSQVAEVAPVEAAQ